MELKFEKTSASADSLPPIYKLPAISVRLLKPDMDVTSLLWLMNRLPAKKVNSSKPGKSPSAMGYQKRPYSSFN